jgi:phosphoribosylaminoimidazole-succinocarboxamide synthase
MLTADRYLRSGKVRDLFRIDDRRLAIVASDRISAFDVVLPTPIPDKGRVLTGLSRYWFDTTRDIVPNHLLETDVEEVARVLPGESAAELRGRTTICRTAAVLPIELVVRGYIAGSGWKEYLQTGRVCGIPLPGMLRESDRLPAPIFTPATKAEEGEHDVNIEFDSMVGRLADWAPDGERPLGEADARSLATRTRDVALTLYAAAVERCAAAGIVLADTKFEMGLIDGELTLVDEVLTPDSSRFWDRQTYSPGRPQASFDKQFARDWLEGQPWDKTAPGPELPVQVVAGTRQRYVEAFERITGASFDRYLEEDVIAP